MPCHRIAQVVSLVAFFGIIGPAILYVNGTLDLPSTKFWMLLATVAWFAATPVWMGREERSSTN